MLSSDLSWVVPLRRKTFTIFREEATSALVSFHMTSILVELEFGVLVIVKGGKPRNPAKNPWSKERTNSKLNPHTAPSRNQTQAPLLSSLCHPCSPIDSKNLTHCKVKENYSALVWMNYSSTKLMTFYNTEDVLTWKNKMDRPKDTTLYMLERAWNLSSLSRHNTKTCLMLSRLSSSRRSRMGRVSGTNLCANVITSSS